MAKNDLKREGRSGLDTVNGSDADNARVIDEGVFGSLSELDTGRLVAKPISIYEIVPDPQQPRRLLPGSLRYEGAVADVLAAWWDLAADEAGRDIQVIALLRGEETERTQENVDRSVRLIESGLMKLIELAATIRRDGGLINPITVYRVGDHYQIETGERRWLAHHLLAAALNEPQWQKISAREVKAPSIWRQAHENTARDNLNAISMARQLALLLMDIYRDLGLEFESYENFNFDRHFYAQVADGKQFPIPYGDGERIVAAMGLKNRVQVNQYRALLRLPDNTWESADAQNLVESALREMLRWIARPEEPSMQAHESITTVIVSPQADLDAIGDFPSGVNPPVEGDELGEVWLLPWQRNLLIWAYKRAMHEQTPWFSAINTNATPNQLNKMIAEGLLEGRGSKENSNYHVAFYRIAPDGCKAIDEEPVKYDGANGPLRTQPPGSERLAPSGPQTPPRTETQARSGSPEIPQPPVTPPRRSIKKLFDSAERGILTTATELTDANLDTADGLNGTIDSIDHAISVLNRKLAELRTRQ